MTGDASRKQEYLGSSPAPERSFLMLANVEGCQVSLFGFSLIFSRKCFMSIEGPERAFGSVRLIQECFRDSFSLLQNRKKIATSLGCSRFSVMENRFTSFKYEIRRKLLRKVSTSPENQKLRVVFGFLGMLRLFSIVVPKYRKNTYS